MLGEEQIVMGNDTGIKACRGFILIWALLLGTLWLSGSATADEPVNYRLKWLINMSTVGDIFAETQGFFGNAGLKVAIKPGGPERDAIRELELGYADFGVASADQVITALAKGSPVVVIAQLFQVNPLQWIYFKHDTHIETPADLKGKTIGVTFGKNDEIIMRTLLSRQGIAERQVRLFSVRLDYTPFYKKEVALWPVYINSQGVEIGTKLEKAGEPVGFFNPATHGVRFVANSVVVSERLMAQKPELVQRFLNALLQGWEAALAPDAAKQAVTAVRKYDRDTSNEVLSAQLAATRPLIQPTAETKIGQIDIRAWEQTEQIMLKYGLIAKPVHIAQHLKPLAPQP